MKSERAQHIVNIDNEIWFCPYCECAIEVDYLLTEKKFTHKEKCYRCGKDVIIDNHIDEVIYE